ncbi:hypothetical protein RJT34_33287 [Clitoria ternatea]|uniref:Uncharacterized protein n=1 Tax=Clitoria ternatea TaxID=43366 RepID=A0AAN9EXK1_CLITE
MPYELHNDTPIFVLASAGMRRSLRDDADLVLGDFQADVNDQSFMFSESWTWVLNGREEAYGCVALKYKRESFGKFGSTYQKNHSQPP